MTLRIRRSLRGCLRLVLLFGIMGANGKCDLAMEIWAGLQEQIDDNREQIDSQQQQIDQLTETVCGLSVLTGSPTHPVFCAPEKQDGDGGGASGGGCSPHTYIGRQNYYRDPEIELYFVSARYYDPATGNFISKDPIGILGGDPNFYRYVVNNPVNI